MRSGKQDQLLAFLAQAVPVYERAPGIRVRLLWSLDETDRFVEIIEYPSVAAQVEDDLRISEDDELGALIAQWRSLLAEPVEVERYVDVGRGWE